MKSILAGLAMTALLPGFAQAQGLPCYDVMPPAPVKNLRILTGPPSSPIVTAGTAVVPGGLNNFRGCLWDGVNFNTLDTRAASGPLQAVPVPDVATALDINWGTGAPDAITGAGTFSAHWVGTFTFKAGTYTFTAGSDDGLRVRLNGVIKIDHWIDRLYAEDSFTALFPSQTTLPLAVDYYENTGPARVQLRWAYAVSPALPPPLSGTPAITSVSGKLDDGQLVVVQGTGFGSKNPAPPLIWADFESGQIQPSPLGRRRNWDDAQNFHITTQNQPAGSNSSVVGIWDNTPWPNGVSSFSFRIDKTQAQGYWTRIYNYQKRYYSFTATSNQKYWRLWPESGGNDFVAAYDSGGGRCVNEDEGRRGGEPIPSDSWQGTRPPAQKWMIEEFIWQHAGGTGLKRDATPGNGTGIWDYTRDGVREQHREEVNNDPSNHVQLRTDNFTHSQALPPDASRVYMDDIYVDDSYARVMLGNADTWAASSKREIMIPADWSDSSVAVTVHKGGFNPGETVFLYVFDANNVPNAVGFPVIVGGQVSVTGP